MPSALQLSARLAYRALGPRLQAELVIRFGFVTRRVVRQAPPTREAKAGLYLRRGRAPGVRQKRGKWPDMSEPATPRLTPVSGRLHGRRPAGRATRPAARALYLSLKGTSNNDVFFVGLIAGAARR
jgi:hypothetical protein